MTFATPADNSSGSNLHALPRLWLLRHGETEWSKSGQYTGLTDLPLTAKGEQQAIDAAPKLADLDFGLVLTSPLVRARRTAELAGYPDAEVTEDAHEWDYGDYEGRRSADIRTEDPGYLIWSQGVPNGETIDDVAARADRIVSRVKNGGIANVLLVAHGHFLRILAARWLELPPTEGKHFLLGTAAVCSLGWDKRTPAIEHWSL
ncbi:histidine phosphatase family protein [Glaciibacter superstes]|uniref:histidine phosphatase family protein n=1 Tax=Glaciibacter superstes TaxID=501023 RepID=UPI0003B59010|nr:histidine phosphatase family protein [Glaciibacter superstes]